ncbi:metallophosphoesterase [Ruminococcaceae bacterium OttesenSCG-928-N02]|nr:metallophosphoesterase [Ruminococcaceae bacterium OttesenSCG-928-N02]
MKRKPMGEKMLYVIGDLHGDLNRLKEPAIKRLTKRDTLIVLGDFGFLWAGDEREKRNLKWLSQRKFNLLFIEGTKDNYDLLREYPVQEFAGGRCRHIGGNVRQLMRGEIFTIEDMKLFCFGGGESQDKAERTEGVNWWRSEMPTADELDNAEENLAKNKWQVDYILTHEPSAKLSLFIDQERIETNRLGRFFDELAEKVTYKTWYCGCFHRDMAIGTKAAVVYRTPVQLKV